MLRYRPEDTYQTPEVVATFKPTKFSYIHSFSLTQQFAVFLFYPVIIDPKRYPESNFHAFEAEILEIPEQFTHRLTNQWTELLPDLRPPVV